MERQLIFEGHSLATIINYDQNGYQSTLKQNNVPCTAAQEGQSMEEERFYQKEDLNSQDSCEISFEKILMAQHAAVLTQELKNYLKSAQTYLFLSNKQILEIFTQRTNKPNQQTSCQDFVSNFDGLLTFQLKNKLLNELKANDRLFQMFTIVAKGCPLQMTIELMTISLQILDQYKKRVANSDESLDLFSLMDIAFEKSKNIENVHTLNLSFIPSFQHRERKFMLVYQKFMEIYCVTTILVLAEYFQNPYYERHQQEQLPKRLLKQLDDDVEMEEEVDTRPQKRRKSSK